MRSPTPGFIVASVAASLLTAASADAATGFSRFAAATSAAPTTSATTAGTTSTGTTSGTTTAGTTPGTTTATTAGTTTATTTGTTTSIPSQLNKSLYPQGPTNAVPTTNVTNNSGIGQTATTFNNGAQFIVNADGTVQMLSGVPTITTTGTTATGTTANGTTAGRTLSAANGTTTGNTTNINPVAADVFGTSPGQTSVGTFAGNSSAGIVDSGAIVANSNAAVAGFAPGVVVGGIATTGVGAIDTGATQDSGSGVNANGERLASLGGFGSTGVSTQVATIRTPTPTYDLVTRAAAAREANRRARGETPRIYGIAPRTDNDRTDQMPDDPIIRY